MHCINHSIRQFLTFVYEAEHGKENHPKRKAWQEGKAPGKPEAPDYLEYFTCMPCKREQEGLQAKTLHVDKEEIWHLLRSLIDCAFFRRVK